MIERCAFGGAARNLGGRGKALPFAPVGEITAGVIKQGVNVCRCRFAAKMLCVRSTRHSLYHSSKPKASILISLHPSPRKVASLVTKRECVRKLLFLYPCLSLYHYHYLYLYLYLGFFRLFSLSEKPNGFFRFFSVLKKANGFSLS